MRKMFRRRKRAPKITTEDYALEYDTRAEGWQLRYAGVDFYSPGHEIALPRTQQLDQYIDWINSNKEYMDSRVSEMCAQMDGLLNASAAHVGLVQMEGPGEIYVAILGDETWGDMGYDFWLRDGEIIGEGVAD